ncbi:hypothetical protein NEUTE1DRAFT_114870 [Neurospora tetrasperma FGSC 2508]|uniref:Uncharacterized protein n=1 Tax=Neurospora tetrasperma (strain FGSC 2508 / ATCC MYA-4615 / P0657) TaxID=510951 RepID=F8N0Q8_NEUT8|nr:uncharacterized protein NEUTE1DRAFT_114870 [Neurospora tetrasperma FGSC 2508]EGO52994.1 hypothetical protein NEUTE1DRAFT_114870 [Neurospora tetrasperma FGSC 2508]
MPSWWFMQGSETSWTTEDFNHTDATIPFLGYLPFRNNKTRVPSHRRNTERERDGHYNIKNSVLIHLSTQHISAASTHPSSSYNQPTYQHFLFFPLVSAFDLDRVQSSNEDEWSYSKPNQCHFFHPHV